MRVRYVPLTDFDDACQRRCTPRTCAVTSRHAFWMRSARGDRASWLHVPTAGCQRPAGVVICAPAGHEYTHSYRSLLHLADRLAEAGLPAIRFDYYACGSSAGDAMDANLVETWIEDVKAAARVMETLTGRQASLVGLRLGATLAGLAASRIDVDHLVAWAPVVNGRQYVRELTALAALEGGVAGSGLVEAGGFALSAETIEHLKSIDMTGLTYRVRGKALVLEREPRVGEERLAARCREQGLPAYVMPSVGYEPMMDKPHFSVLPNDAIASIVGFLHGRSPAPAAAAVVARPARVTSTIDTTVQEELVHVPGETPMFGVLTTPRSTALAERPLLLLTNAGSAHSVGPNRLYVEIARGVAAAGFSTLRLDLRNLGDSIRGQPVQENHPYPRSAVADVERVLDWLLRDRDVNRVVLGGLCSAAYHALVCGRDLSCPSLQGMLMINPLTFTWSEGDALDAPGEARYHGSILEKRKWKKLWRGAYDSRAMITFVVRAARKRASGLAARVLDALEMNAPHSLGPGLQRAVERGRTLDFVFSRFDPGHALLKARAGSTLRTLERDGVLSVSFVDGADHGFSRADRRRELVRVIVDRLRKYPARVPDRSKHVARAAAASNGATATSRSWRTRSTTSATHG